MLNDLTFLIIVLIILINTIWLIRKVFYANKWIELITYSILVLASLYILANTFVQLSINPYLTF